MDGLFEKIDFNVEFIDEISLIKNDQNKIRVYGAGSLAFDIINRLEHAGIEVDCAFVDDEYYRDGMQVAGKSVVNTKTALLSECSVVVAIENYFVGRDIEKYSKVKSVYYILNPAYDIDYTRILSKRDMLSNKKDFESVYMRLADDVSRKSMLSFIEACLSGNARKVFKSYRGEQNFFNNDIYKAEAYDNLVDIGAYTGDTLLQYFECVKGNMGKVWAIEGDDAFIGRLRNLIDSRFKDFDIELIHCILGSESGYAKLKAVNDNPQENEVFIEKGKTGKEIKMVDSILQNRKDHAGIMKINFPNPLVVLKGARQVITEDHPKLGVIVGYDGLDCIRVPLYVWSLDDRYKVYFRYMKAFPQKLTMFAIC